MKNSSPRLSRLLGDYERLTLNEGAALRARDFVAWAAMRELKPELLLAIEKEGRLLGADRRVVWFRDRLNALAELETDNIKYAGRAMIQIKARRDSLEVARKRLRGLGNAYRRLGANTSHFFVRS